VASLKNIDTVISAVGGADLTTITRTLIEAVTEAKIPTLIVTGGAGSLPAAEGTGKTYNCMLDWLDLLDAAVQSHL
jgi:putative NADH-flavin reductase